jgi:hypothetical protein
MRESDWKAVLDAVGAPALAYLESLPDRPVYRRADPSEILSLVGERRPEHGLPAEQVVADLARDLQPFVTAHASGRFFGFVIGGLHPASRARRASTWSSSPRCMAPSRGRCATWAWVTAAPSRWPRIAARGSCRNGSMGCCAPWRVQRSSAWRPAT